MEENARGIRFLFKLKKYQKIETYSMKPIKSSLLAFLLLTFASTSTSTVMAQEITDLSQFEFMLGEWRAEFPSGAFCESWTKESDTRFVGSAYQVQGGDSTLSETLSLEIIDDGYRNGIYYVATPVLQDSTFFKFITGTDEDAEFQDPGHDFPQRIVYRKIDADRMFVVVGNLGENSKQLEFDFIRIKR